MIVEIYTLLNLVLSGRVYLERAEANEGGKYCLRYHIYRTPKHVQLKDLISSPFQNGLTWATEGKDGKTADNSGVVVPDTEGSGSEDLHHGWANAIFMMVEWIAT